MARIHIFHRGRELYRYLEHEIEHAEREILISVYSFQNDEIGERFSALLKKKAGQGVTVKIILDGWLTSKQNEREIANKLWGNGVNIKVFRSWSSYLCRHPILFLRRNHARIFLIDRKLMGLGGMGIGKAYDDREDLFVFFPISSPESVIAYFDNLWTLADGTDGIAALPDYSRRSLSPAPRITALISTPVKKEQKIYQWFLARIEEAKERIIIVSAWFLPTAELLSGLIGAKERGVEVVIVTPRHTDRRRYDEFRGSAVPRLLEKKILWYAGGEYFHQKFSVIDDYWCLGSANFDMISMNRNYELNIWGQGGSILGELEDNYKNLLSKSEPVTKNQLLWIMRLGSGIIHPLLETFMATTD